MSKDCSKCKNLKKSVYMILEDEVLYNYWCEAKKVEDENCCNFEDNE